MAKFYAGISLPNKNKILSFEPIVVDVNRISEIIPYYDFYIRDRYAKEIIKIPTSKIIIPHRGIKNGIYILMGSPTDIYYDIRNNTSTDDKIPSILDEVNRILSINIERYYKSNVSIYDLGYEIDKSRSTTSSIYFIPKSDNGGNDEKDRDKTE